MQGSLLDAEFEKISPALSETLNQINGQITQGLTPSQIAVATIALPVIYQVLRMVSDGRREKRERLTREHNAKLELETMAKRMALEREHAAGMKSIGAPPPG